MANALKSLEVAKGDVVAIYMPTIAEAVFAILACAKIGAIHTVIFSGFSADSLRIRLQDCSAKILFTTDGFIRKGKPISQKKTVENALVDTKVSKTIVVNYKGVDSFDFKPGFLPYCNIVKNQDIQCKTESMDSESPLFILYTSGTTGRPKGAIHVHGGFAVFAAHQSAYLIDQKKDDRLFWPADIGWITGLTWNIFGTLETGSTAIIYDGALNWPDDERLWKIILDYKITIFGISPTAIRMIKSKPEQSALLDELQSVRIIATTGEPIDEETWWWLFEKVGKKKCPIMNLSGGTEVGGAFLSVLPGMKIKPSTVGMPCPGIDADVFDEYGRSLRMQKGFLVVKSPWPAITRGLLNDDKRYLKTYWSKFEDVWFHGDLASIDNDGLWYLHGRVDDVINVSGHRISTAEIEESLLSHQKIADVAAVAIPDEITGEAVAIFATMNPGFDVIGIEDELRDFISDRIGKLARPKIIRIVGGLPKTRTGKIVRRLLKAKLLGTTLGDLSSVENPQVLDEI
ncbi:MAG: acyl-CoA synthetase [Nitrosotalea sp.]